MRKVSGPQVVTPVEALERPRPAQIQEAPGPVTTYVLPDQQPAPAMWSRRPGAERPQRAGQRPEPGKRHTVRQSGTGGRARRKPVARL